MLSYFFANFAEAKKKFCRFHNEVKDPCETETF